MRDDDEVMDADEPTDTVADTVADTDTDTVADTDTDTVADTDTDTVAVTDTVAGTDTDTDTAPDPEQPQVFSGRLASVLESLLFAADKPLSVAKLQEVVGERDGKVIEAALADVQAHYAERGLQLIEVAGGYQFRTAPENGAWVQRLVAGKPVRLSRAQLETLAIVSYRQPITRPEVDEIRGVDSGAVLRVLLDRGLVRILGKKEEPGRPLLYGTTKEFLEFFNLKDLRDLPTLREFAELTAENQARVEALEGDKAEAEAPATTASLAPVRTLAEDLPPIDSTEEEALLGDLAAAEQAAEQATAPFRAKPSGPAAQAEAAGGESTQGEAADAQPSVPAEAAE